MTKSNEGAQITPANFCMHCGLAIRVVAAAAVGDVAAAARELDAAFCCNCGAALDDGGKCPNSQCKFSGFTPHCS